MGKFEFDEKGDLEEVTSFLSDWDFQVYNTLKPSPDCRKFPTKEENTITEEESKQTTEMTVLVQKQGQAKQLLNIEEIDEFILKRSEQFVQYQNSNELFQKILQEW